MLFLQKLWAVLGEKAATTRPGNLVTRICRWRCA